MNSLVYNRDIVILTGQSNLNGGFQPSWYLPFGDEIQPRVTNVAYQMTVGVEKMKPMTQVLSADVIRAPVECLAMQLARRLRAFGWNPAIVQYGIGGSYMYTQWRPTGASTLYPQWSRGIRDYLQYFKRSRIRCWVHYQGEFDAMDSTYANAWAAGMAECATSFRSFVGLPGLRAYVVQLPDTAPYAYRDTVRAQQASFAVTDLYSGLIVPPAGIQHIGGQNVGHIAASGHAQVADAIAAKIRPCTAIAWN